MGQRVGADLMPRPKPVPHLRRIHHRLGGLAQGHIPLVASAQQISHKKLDGFEPRARQRLQPVAQHIDVTIVERNDNPLFLQRPRAHIECPGGEPRLAQFLKLAGEQPAADIKSLEPRPPRSRPQLVVGQDRIALTEKPPEWSQRGIIGRRVGQSLVLAHW